MDKFEHWLEYTVVGRIVLVALMGATVYGSIILMYVIFG